MAFVPLFCRTHHSPHGVTSIADLVRRARSLGYSTLGICDEATIGGFHEFNHECTEGGIRPVFGCRLPVKGFTLTGLSFPWDFLIQTEQGYRNLVRLLSIYHRQPKSERRPIEAYELTEMTEGLTVVMPIDGELHTLLAERDRNKIETLMQKAIAAFGNQLLIAVASKGPAAEHAFMASQLAHFAKLTAIGPETVEYAEPGDDAAEVYLRNPLGAPGRSYKPPSQGKRLPALLPESDILARWPEPLSELVHETSNVARLCNWRPATLRRAFPMFDLDRGFDPNSYLFDLVINGASRRYGEIREELKQRINREFEDVKTHQLAPWLLLNYHIAKILDEKGVSRGVGRGRTIASVLAYCLGITRIDPLEYQLRPQSLAIEGQVFPPLAVEIPRKAQPVLIEWLAKEFGEDHLAEIGKLRYTRRDHLIQEIAVWSGMTDEEKHLLQAEKKRLRSAGAAQRLSEMTQEQTTRRWRDAAFASALVARLAPRPRQWEGSGDRYALSSEALENVLPVLHGETEMPITGLEDPAIDRLGLARILFVPHQLLDILDRAMALASSRRRRIDWRTIPLGDKATFELLGRGDTLGIPPLESITMRCLLRKMSPSNLLQLLGVKTTGDTRKSGELTEQLPDVLLSYQCAFLKNIDPLAFYCAAISTTIEAHRNPLPIIRAVRRIGYEVHGPDIMLSEFNSTVQGEAIRLGLATVAHLGPKAWENIKHKRDGDPFNSFEHFCEMIDFRVVKRNIVHGLIGAGALDRFGYSRARMDAMVERMARRARVRHHSEGDEVQATLFGEDEFWQGDPDVPTSEEENATDWSPSQKLQRESEALGFYLSIDPLERFEYTLRQLKPMQVESLTRRQLHQQVRLTGIVCEAQEESVLSKEAGTVLLDLEGMPVTVPPALAVHYQSCFEVGAEVFVIGTPERSDGYLCIQAEGIWRLGDLEAQAKTVARIGLDLAGEQRATLKLLIDLMKQFPGQTRVEVEGYEGRRGLLMRRLTSRGIFFCSPLYQSLCRILSPTAITLYDAEGVELEVKAAGK